MKKSKLLSILIALVLSFPILSIEAGKTHQRDKNPWRRELSKKQIASYEDIEDSQDADLYLKKIRVQQLVKVKKYAEAELIDEEIYNLCKDKESFCELENALLIQGKYEKVIQLYQNSPFVNEPDIQFKLGYSFSLIGKYEQAESWLLKASESDIPWIRDDAEFELAMLYKNAGKYDQAEEIFCSQAVQGSGEAAYQLGLIYLIKGEFAFSEGKWKQTVYYMDKASTWFEWADTEKARAILTSLSLL